METTSAIWSGFTGRLLETWRLESFLGLREDRAFYVGRSYDADEPLLIQLIAAGGHSPVRAAWEHARTLSHEHLMRVRATGETDLDGTHVAYAVLDLPDDDLGEILGRRALDGAEAVTMHTAIADALDYLHRRGFRHGAIVASNIFLLRDQIKLAVDSISPAGEADQQTDLQQLASLGLPALPVANEAPRRYGRPIAAAAAVAIALVTGYLLIHRQVRPPTPQLTAIPKRQPVEKPQPPPAARSFAAVRRPSWAVVAATYGNFNGAEKRAAEIRKRARLQAHVFPAAGEGRLYFVVLGSGLSQDAAERLRRHALALGAPRDTYVTKLDES